MDAFLLKDAERILIDTLIGDVEACLPSFDSFTFNLGPLWSKTPQKRHALFV